MLRKNVLLSVVMIAAFAAAMTPWPALSDEAAAAPKVSTFAPAEDLARQAEKYIASMKDTVASEQEYKDSEGKVGREANTLIVIALALGLNDQGSKYKAGAAAVMKAAQDVAATKDYESAKKAVDALEKVVEEGAAGGGLKWEKVASLPELMKQVPNIDTKLKLCLKGANFKKKAKESAGHSAVIAAIAQGSIADTSATKNAGQIKQWQDFCKAMRKYAGEVNAAVHKGDREATDKAMTKLSQSCEDCHAVFKPAALANPAAK